MSAAHELVRAIEDRGARIVGVGGAPGAGKSTAARAAAAELGGTLVVSLDDYYLSKAERVAGGMKWRGPPGSHDVPAFLALLDRVRERRGPLTVERFSAEIDDRIDPVTVDVPDKLIVEGMLLGHRADGYGAILDRLDLFAFIDVPADVARQRRFSREVSLDGGFSDERMKAFWDEVLEPVIDQIIPQAKAAADLILEG